MKFSLSILGLALLLVGIARAETLRSQAFTDTAAAAARAAVPSAQVAVKGDLQLEARGPGGARITLDLGNTYEIYLRSPQRLDDLIHHAADALVDAMRFDHAKVDRSRIIPVLKPRRWLDGLLQAQRTQTTSAQSPEFLTEPFNTELAVVYAEDLPSTTHFLMARDDFGDRAQLRNLALGNLRRLLPEIEIQPDGDGIFRVGAGGVYETSLLLIDAIWSSGQVKVDGDIVVAVPDRGVLLVTGSRNRAGIARLRAMAAELATGPYALTSALFIRSDGKFVKFEGN
jgi:uncharacterized protein YtpQ (UPF0354 family)